MVGRKKKHHTEAVRIETKKIQTKKYAQSSKGKATLARYARSSAGKATRKKHRLTDKGKASKRKHEQTEKAIQTKKKYRRMYDKTERGKAVRKRYDQSPKGVMSHRYNSAKRRALLKSNTPKWNKEDLSKKIYDIALKMEKSLGVPVDVDHIIPLQGKSFEDKAEVCGLNVWYNLMPIVEEINESKHDLCPPVKKIPGIKTPQLTLDTLPKPKDWMTFIDFILKRAIESTKKTNEENWEPVKKNYTEVNPKKMR